MELKDSMKPALAAKLTQIYEVDRYAGVWLELCWVFGLRLREAVMLRPQAAHEGEFLWLREGTKGDLPRAVPIRTQAQADVLERAKRLADKNTGVLWARGKTAEQKIKRLYDVMKLVGLPESDIRRACA